MNWLKVAAVVVGGIVVYFVVHTVIGILLSAIAMIAFVAIVAGGVYAAVKLSGVRKRRAVRRPADRAERQVRREPRAERTDRIDHEIETRPVVPRPAPAQHHDVEDELARLKREMGS